MMAGDFNMGEAMNEVRLSVQGRLRDERRRSRSDIITHPAVGRPATKEERRAKYLELRDPPTFEAALDEQGAKWGLKPGAISRDVVEFFAQEHNEFMKEQGNA